MIDTEVLTFLSNIINYTIFVFITINLINTSCFDFFQMSIAAFGLFTSILVQIISLVIRRLK